MISVSVGPSMSLSFRGFRPTMIGGVLLWVDAHYVTTVDAAVTAPSDLTDVSWTKVSCTASAVDTLTDTNDSGTPTQHYTSVQPGLQANHEATFSIEAKAGTLDWIYLQLGNGSVYTYADLTNGVVGTFAGGTASIEDMGGGWYKVTLVGTPNAAIAYIEMANADNGGIYAGTGTGTVKVRNVSMTQKNVSVMLDQSKAGHNLAQGTAAKRPLWEPTGLNGRPSIRGDGVDDFISASFTANQPTHTFFVGQYVVAADDARIVDGTTTNSNGMRVVTNNFYYHCGAQLGPSSSVSATGAHVFSMLANSTSSEARFDGAHALTGDAGTNNPGGAVLFAMAGGTAGFADARISEFIMYDHALTANEKHAVERYLGLKWGITVA